MAATHFVLGHLAKRAWAAVGKDVGEIEQILVAQGCNRRFYCSKAIEHAFDHRFVAFNP
ncbi:hypothetical protein [Sphingomonas sp. 8AM]|uniref:hypothetical protein n=1 Tax=Sphingomonas sp. 8AM TaxID=2653170 RepID=UPI0012F12881|nr:hypothetical protein [Sphingomonas sp. 8AM]VXD01571.1 hypothetical protein SPHINGO8AM_80087 [Sphingomonas sp. 8AM]